MTIKIKKTIVPSTPIVLAYFAEKHSGTHQEVIRFVYNVARKIRESNNLSINAIFRGYLNNPDKGLITSETVDNDLSYWFYNGFLKTEPNGDDLCFKIDSNKMYIFDSYLIRNLLNNLDGINWIRESDKEEFVNILSETLGLQ